MRLGDSIPESGQGPRRAWGVVHVLPITDGALRLATTENGAAAAVQSRPRAALIGSRGRHRPVPRSMIGSERKPFLRNVERSSGASASSYDRRSTTLVSHSVALSGRGPAPPPGPPGPAPRPAPS